MIRKYATMLALTVSAMLFLPAMSFAKGAVIGYAMGGTTPQPTAAQLDRLTHVMVFQMFPNATGGLITSPYLVPAWLSSFVTTAHAKNIKVSIAVGGWSTVYTKNFITATNDVNRPTFVGNIVKFVSDHNLDGVDIDWEYPQVGENTDPQRLAEWNQCIALIKDLKAALPDKRISMAIPGYTPTTTWFFGNSSIAGQIWDAVDAVHLMTYDMHAWPTHSDAEKSKTVIDTWANWGSTGGRNFDKEKLVIGCAFYGYQYPAGKDPVSIRYNAGATNSDTPASLKNKVDHCYDKGYGGVMIWELSQDKYITTTPELLSAIWNATQDKGGYNNIETVTAQSPVQIYPNPATTELYVKLDAQEAVDYVICDNVGQIVLQGKLQDNSTINIQSLPNGIYYLRASGKTVKIIKN